MRKSNNKPVEPTPQWDDDHWPIGMNPNGELNILTEEESIEMLIHRDWHRYATQFFGEFGIPQSPDEAAKKLFSIFLKWHKKPSGEWNPKRHILRAMALDTMVASFPEGSPPSEKLIDMMKLALGLPDYHRVGSWLGDEGAADGRGKPDLSARRVAEDADKKYLREHDGEWMPLAAFARQLGKPESYRRTLRRWRARADYCPGWRKPVSGS
ncbi:MAG: hypothetical protein M9932_00685 [Xanthobacteraceae bacterium]|nr:hypothetical protein [Xanthobacteraceae bacterium]